MTVDKPAVHPTVASRCASGRSSAPLVASALVRSCTRLRESGYAQLNISWRERRASDAPSKFVHNSQLRLGASCFRGVRRAYFRSFEHRIASHTATLHDASQVKYRMLKKLERQIERLHTDIRLRTLVKVCRPTLASMYPR